jgi:D-alanyl-lipoteichoic acid acyltransferase DltB (MBOAT superfamily)
LPWTAWLAFSTTVLKLTKVYVNFPVIVGVSYLSFRCSRLVLEVRNGAVEKPGLWQYLGFAFFVPIIPLGPINTYANHRRGFEVAPWDVPVGRAALRVLVGLVKYEFLGGICNQLSYANYLLNGHPHHWIDLPIAMSFYYLYLYLNFSGFCDMAIGAAALIGIPVLENFDNPLGARNMKEFWNRWHITLSQWMRDIVFAPLSKFLAGVMGPANVNHAIALSIFVVFLLIGIWHGVGWNFVLFGFFNALGVIANLYYTLGLKKWLGRERFKAYNENRWIHALAVAATFCYFAATLLFFANTVTQIKDIWDILR